MYLSRQREVLQVISDIDDMLESLYDLWRLRLFQGGAGFCSPLGMISPAIVASKIASFSELQIPYPETREMFADGQSFLPTVLVYHAVAVELTKLD